MLGLANRNLILCEFDVNCNKKMVQFHPTGSKRILQNEFVSFFTPLDKFAESIKTNP